MTPFSSVAILEKLALLKIASCKAPVFSRASSRRTSVITSAVRAVSSAKSANTGDRKSTRLNSSHSQHDALPISIKNCVLQGPGFQQGLFAADLRDHVRRPGGIFGEVR